MTQNPNQFMQSSQKGDLDLQVVGAVLSGAVATGQTAAIVAGEAVKLEDSAGALPKFESLDAATDVAHGIALRNLKDVDYSAEDRIEVAIFGSVVHMEAGAAVARGAQVEYALTGAKVIASAGTNPVIGRALDKASADGDLIRVYITTLV